MKILALILVVIGTGLAAASGSRNIDDLVEWQRLEVAGTAAADRVEEARVAYCEARESAGLGAGDGCGGAELEVIQPDPRDDGEDEAGLRAVGRDRTRKLKAARPDALPSDVAQKREAWIGLYEETIDSRAVGAARVQLPGPGARLAAWAGMTGLWFALGLILVIAGAVMGRVAIRREVTQPDEASSTEETSDASGTFDGTLAELLSGAQGVVTRFGEVTDPGESDFEEAQAEVERLQLDCIEPLVAARTRIQTLHGMAAFAAIFGPLSAGERNLNRVWSALVDRHWPEAMWSA
ncbi:MAG: hypothetical protein VX938_03375, partial [Myxococcota bacterium]|nr:hypothetical protein [Myxococcota bacterium]